MIWCGAVLSACASAGVLWLSNMTILFSPGSDFLLEIIAPSLAGQIIVLLVLCGCLAYAAMSLVAHRRPVGISALGVITVFLLTMGSHRILIDGGRGEIRDVWLLTTVQTLTFGLMDGPAGTARLTMGFAADWIVPHDGHPMLLIHGLPPVALDLDRVRRWWR